MTWNKNEELWNRLDKMMLNCREDLEDFLNELFKHHEELDLVGQAILFGGLGKLVMTYNHERHTKTAEESLAIAFQAMHSDRRVQQLMGLSVEKTIDAKVAQMKGE